MSTHVHRSPEEVAQRTAHAFRTLHIMVQAHTIAKGNAPSEVELAKLTKLAAIATDQLFQHLQTEHAGVFPRHL